MNQGKPPPPPPPTQKKKRIMEENDFLKKKPKIVQITLEDKVEYSVDESELLEWAFHWVEEEQ